MRNKLKKAMNSKFTRIAVASTVATIAGTISTIAVGTALVKMPIGIGVRILAQIVTYSVTSNITYEVVQVKLEQKAIARDNPYIEEAVVIPPPPIN